MTTATGRLRRWCRALLLLILGLHATACVHKIQVTPTPSEPAATPIPGTAQIQVPFLALEGPDHMPGIVLLEWRAKDLQRAIVDYFARRETFTAVGTEPGEWRVVVKSWLTMRAPDRYVYRIHLEADISRPGQPVLKSYGADGEATGSSVRWVTSSDQEPINEATNRALDDLARKIEADRELLPTLKTLAPR